MPENRSTHLVLWENLYSEGDLVKMVVILALVLVSLMVTVCALGNHVEQYYPLVYCLPIVLISLWFPRQGLKVTSVLVAGFLLIHLHYFTIGSSVDLISLGLYSSLFFWMLGATSLFTKNTHLAVSRYKRLIEEADDARFLCDTGTLRILAVNRRCAEIFGCEPYELLGVPPETLWADAAELQRFADAMRREGYVGNLEQTFLTRSGDFHAVLLSCRSLPPDTLYECSVVDIGQFRSERDQLLKSNGRLQSLIHQSHDLIFMQDADGRFLHFYWVRAEENGIDPAVIVGKRMDALLPSDAAERHALQLAEVIETRRATTYDLTCDFNGSSHVFSVTLSPMLGGGGNLIGIVGVARDVTEVKQQKMVCMQLEWEIDHWKEFLTTAAHELRTPLQPIIGYLRLMLDDPDYYGLNEEACRILALCLESSGHERAVVDKMLDLSLLAMEHVELHIADVDLRALIDTVVLDGGYDQQAEIANEVPENLYIRGDSDRMYQVLGSLISNAVKYNSPPKNVWIRYTESNQNHYIMVTDNGIGIPYEVLGSIFRPFYVGDATQLNRECGRLGLGLSIAKKYVQMHGGEITVASDVGAGSTFTIRISKEV
ncbi:PAS domain-containing sensor histidine kinase [Methanoculleus sp. FWC-SCC1]|uniref:histidine kinase n=1 Tax=Methanoculleus frigidifontis TaxID=2584085 RepID=A0ABT8MB70_9EURY|nr:PAS domain-containing sensor histidine kinase [Methanoculleus sp. FWC-SCC1]MDN7025188.1 PAS domain-containing sensor histidine kinase [Methanoculleus sp. FWC-SCC1]